MLTCKKCGETKPEAEFQPEPRNRSGRNSACRVCVNARNRTYRYAPRRNKPWAERTETQRTWDREHPEQARGRQKRYYDTKRKHQPRDPEYVRAYVNARRARLAEAEGSHTIAEWRALVAEFGGRCVFPGCESTKVTRDHVVPLSAGGSDFITNIQPLCRQHNSEKLTATVDYRPAARAALGTTDSCEVKTIANTAEAAEVEAELPAEVPAGV